MVLSEKDTTLTFRVTAPLGLPEVLDLRDQIIDAMKPLGIRVSQIDPSTIVRMMVDRSALIARAGADPERSDDDGAPHSIEGGEVMA